VLGMTCILFSGLLLLLGIGGLMTSDSHLDYGVKTKLRFKTYCFTLIVLALVIVIASDFIFYQ